MSYLPLIFLYAPAILFSADHAVTKQHDSSVNAPPTQGNRLLFFLFQVALIIEVPIGFVQLNSQFGH